jgi:(p)ppGpp synthase/HD superfamily hydrolase
MESRWSQELYIRAYKYAARSHHGQYVPGSDLPYITHLSFVSMEIMSSLSVGNKRNGDLAVQCALLHDTLEDTGVTYEQVKEKFGIVVACGVQALTKNIKLDENKQMEDSLRRIKKQPKEIWMVKMADRITNLQPPPSHWNNEKRKEYRNEANQIYNSLKDADEYLALRLENKIEDYKNFIIYEN